MVVATYNRSYVLRHAIQSVFDSTFHDFELIVAGDHCTDDTAQVVAAFGDPRIRFIDLPENCGELFWSSTLIAELPPLPSRTSGAPRRPSDGCAAFEWSARDGVAIPIPAGVAHAIYFIEDSVLAFGLSGYWRGELDVVGCRWQDLDSSIAWPASTAALSDRDSASGSFDEMLAHYEALAARFAQAEA